MNMTDFILTLKIKLKKKKNVFNQDLIFLTIIPISQSESQF